MGHPAPARGGDPHKAAFGTAHHEPDRLGRCVPTGTPYTFLRSPVASTRLDCLMGRRANDVAALIFGAENYAEFLRKLLCFCRSILFNGLFYVQLQ